MRRRIRSELIVETEELWLMRRSARRARARCGECAEGVAMITLEEAVALTAVSSRDIHRLAEAGEIHFTETSEGLLLVCLDSLLLQITEKPRCQ